MKDYMGLYTANIKEAIRGGPLRVAIICSGNTAWMASFAWLICYHFSLNYCALFQRAPVWPDGWKYGTLPSVGSSQFGMK